MSAVPRPRIPPPPGLATRTEFRIVAVTNGGKRQIVGMASDLATARSMAERHRPEPWCAHVVVEKRIASPWVPIDPT